MSNLMPQDEKRIAAGERMKMYSFRTLVVPPTYAIELGLAEVHYETRRARGFDREDAKRRAGLR